MGKGIVSLHDWDGTLIRTVVYDSPTDRRKTIKEWHGLYQNRMWKCYIIINPFECSERLQRDGRNSRGKTNYIHKLVLEEP